MTKPKDKNTKFSSQFSAAPVTENFLSGLIIFRKFDFLKFVDVITSQLGCVFQVNSISCTSTITPSHSLFLSLSFSFSFSFSLSLSAHLRWQFSGVRGFVYSSDFNYHPNRKLPSCAKTFYRNHEHTRASKHLLQYPIFVHASRLFMIFFLVRHYKNDHIL